MKPHNYIILTFTWRLDTSRPYCWRDKGR